MHGIMAIEFIAEGNVIAHRVIGSEENLRGRSAPGWRYILSVESPGMPPEPVTVMIDGQPAQVSVSACVLHDLRKAREEILGEPLYKARAHIMHPEGSSTRRGRASRESNYHAVTLRPLP